MDKSTQITQASKRTKINSNFPTSVALYPVRGQADVHPILTRSTLSLVVHGSNGLISKSRAPHLEKGINVARVVSVSTPNTQAAEAPGERLR